MAEINVPAAGGGKAGVRKSKKNSTRVDLTPMVDLGFLLITFFIFTTTMSTPGAMKLVMPKDTNTSNGTEVGESAALTVIPLKDNRLFYYHGKLENALQQNAYGFTGYSFSNGIGQIVREKQLAMDKKSPGSRKDLMLMVKPAPESNYQNLVNVLDEVTINDVRHYAMMDLTDSEKEVAVAKSTAL